MTNQEIKKETGVDVTETIITDEMVIVKFNITNKKETGEVYYKIGRNEMSVDYHGKNGIGTGHDSFDYGQPLSKDNLLEAVEFGHNYLKDNLK